MLLIQEGGPLYVRDQVEAYGKILRQNGGRPRPGGC